MEIDEVFNIKIFGVEVLYSPIKDEVGYKRVEHDERPSNRIWLPREDVLAILKQYTEKKELENEDEGD